MATATPSYLWDVGVFSDCYNAVKFLDSVPDQINALIGMDLRHLLVVPQKSDKARQSLANAENEPVTFSDGLSFRLNKPFIESASLLANELDLDELATAELLLLASGESFSKGSSLEDAGILAFFRRYDYILNIVGYMVTNNRVQMLYSSQDPAKELFQQCIESYKKIYRLIQIQNDQIDKQKATADINNLAFVKKVYYLKQQLFQTHDLLSQIFYSLIDAFPKSLQTAETYSTIVKHINENVTNDSDILLLHFLPSLLRIVTSLEDLPEAEVKKFHQQFVATLKADYPKIKDNDDIDLSKSSLRSYDLCAKLFFFIAFIPWCKASPARTQMFDFKYDILQYVEWLISYGTTEQLLCYTSETAAPETVALLEQSELYDFRALLQGSFPLLWPAKFLYPGNDELLHAAKANPQYSNVAKLCDFSNFKISRAIADDLLAPSFHTFFSGFVNHAAIVLTLLRDNEEDYLLSSNKKELVDSSRNALNFNDTFNHLSSKSLEKRTSETSDSDHDLNDIASRADLERLYMACVYTYSNRKDLCEAFWTTDESNITGFIDWGISKNTSPLITATFSILLGSLTSGGTTASLKVWDILVNANTFRKNDYSYISIDSIIGSLTYYLDALTDNLEQELNSRSRLEQQKLEFLFSSSTHHKRVNDEDTEIPITLSEDSVVFIAGFIMLIAQIVKNADDNEPVSWSLRQSAFASFHPILVSFLKFDNLITSAKGSLNSKRDTVPIIFNEENRSIILNLVMYCLKEFASTDDLLIRTQIWDTVDRWICHALHDGDSVTTADSLRYSGRNSMLTVVSNATKSELQKLKSLYRGSHMKQAFKLALTKPSEVSNFVQLIAQLLEPCSTTQYGFKTLELLYPSNIGSGYRFKNQIGVWPYIEYILNEVFTHTPDLEDESLRVHLQQIILKIIRTSLDEIDWCFLVETAPQIFLETPSPEDVFASSRLLSGEMTTITFETFVRVHHSLAVLNFLFEEKVSAVLFDIVNTGLEIVANNAILQDLIKDALNIVKSTLKLQHVYIEKFLPLLKNADIYSQTDSKKPLGYGTSLSLALSTQKLPHDNVYYPTGLGTHGVSDYYELILFNLSSVVHLGLYVGADEAAISLPAISILRKLSRSKAFSTESDLSKNLSLRNTRLLSIFENVDESVKIRFAFVQQMETISDSLQAKYDILEFLLENLPSSGQITVAHFLLGFDTRSGGLSLSDDSNELSLLDSLIQLLMSTIDLIFDIDYTQGYVTKIGLGPSKLASLTMQVLVRLGKSPAVSTQTLQYIRKYDLFSKLLHKQPKIDDVTLWHSEKFQGNVQDGTKNSFIEDNVSLETFFEFMKYRNLILQYLSIEIHEIRSVTKKEQYIKMLLDDTEFFNGTPKVLNFLDVLNYQFYNFEVQKLLEFENKYNLPALVHHLSQERERKKEVKLLKKFAALRCQNANQRLRTEDEKASFAIDMMSEVTRVDELFQKIFVVEELKKRHLSCLQLWVQTIQVLSSDGVADRADFILKVFQYILPKINNDYYERDILFAEELILLCMLLFDMYEEDSTAKTSSKEGQEHHLQELHPLFKTCVNGVLCTNSTPALRSDLYILLNKFTQRTPQSGLLLSQILTVLRSVDRRFIKVICNDSIYLEGAPRITSIVLLETLVNLLGMEQLTSILDAIVENNSLSLLARLLKRTGELFEACEGSTDSGIRVDTLLYELTAFKATLYLLIRIGQTRDGAVQLFQNEIFSIVRYLKFLNIDSDLGFELQIDSVPRASGCGTKEEKATALITLSLDIPASLADDTKHPQSVRTISYYELLVPAFQLVATVLSAMGPSFQPGIMQAKELMLHFRPLVVGVMKRDQLAEKGDLRRYEEKHSLALEGLRQLARLFVLVNALVEGA